MCQPCLAPPIFLRYCDACIFEPTGLALPLGSIITNSLASVNLLSLTPSKADLIDFPFNASLHALLNFLSQALASECDVSCINSMAIFR